MLGIGQLFGEGRWFKARYEFFKEVFANDQISSIDPFPPHMLSQCLGFHGKISNAS